MRHTPQPLAGEDGSPLDVLADGFAALTVAPDPLALHGAELGHEFPARWIVLDELRDMLLHPATSHAARDAAWAELVRRARERGPAWVVGAAGVALPGLRRIAGRVAAGCGGDAADLDGEVLDGFLHALATVNLDRSRIALNLMRPAYRAGVRARYAHVDPYEPHPGTVASAPPPRPWGHPDLVLADAVTKNILTPVQARLIGATRLEDRPLTAVAADEGLSYWAAHKRRYRAEHRLARSIREGNVAASVSNPGR